MVASYQVAPSPVHAPLAVPVPCVQARVTRCASRVTAVEAQYSCQRDRVALVMVADAGMSFRLNRSRPRQIPDAFEPTYMYWSVP